MYGTVVRKLSLRDTFWRPRSTYQKVQGKCPLHFINFNGVVCSNTLFPNTSALTNTLLFRANSTCKDSRTPRLVEHFWVLILGVSCSNKLFVGALRPSHTLRQNPFAKNPFWDRLIRGSDWQCKLSQNTYSTSRENWTLPLYP